MAVSGAVPLPFEQSFRTRPPGGSRLSVPAQLDQLWDDIRDELRRETPDFKFHIWLEPLELAAVAAKTLYVRAPEHIRTSVAERYLPLLRRAAAQPLRPRMRSSRSSGRRGRAPPRTRPRRAARRPPRGERLNPKYSFEQFVIGEGNRFAHAAALAVAELPGPGLQPALPARPPRASARRTCCTRSATTSSATAPACASATRRSRSSRARSSTPIRAPPHRRLQGRLPRRRRGPDRRRPVPRRPHQDARGVLPHLQRAARLRAPAGDHLRPQPRGPAGPRGPARRALPRRPGRRARAAAGFDCAGRSSPSGPASTASTISASVLTEIALRVDSSVRALEGALIRVVAYASLQGRARRRPALVRHVLRRLGEDTAPDACGISEIIDAAAQEFGVRARRAAGPRPAPGRRHAPARSPCTSLASSPSTASRRSAAASAGRNHTTVLHAVNRISAAMRTDPAVRNAVDNLHRRLGRPA